MSLIRIYLTNVNTCGLSECQSVKNCLNEKVNDQGADVVNECVTCCSQRWVLAYMGLWLGIMAFMLNSNMSIALVCMVKSDSDLNTEFTSYELGLNNSHMNSSADDINTGDWTKFDKGDGNVTSDLLQPQDSCQKHTGSNKFSSEHAEFTWSKRTQSIVLSSFYYGYLIMQIPGGWLASKFGGKRVIGTSMALSAALTLLIPVFARTNVYLVVAARAILGLCMGTTSPSMCGLVGTWALPAERSRMMGMCWFGINVGLVIGYSSSGLLCVHGFDRGWASIFYIQGMLTMVFVGSWFFIVYSSPRSHPRISEAEKRLLLNSIQLLKPKPKRKTAPVPWRSIFSYIPIYVVFITHICDTWTYYLLVTCLPLFLKEVLKFDIESNGFFSCLPYITYMIGIVFSGVCADLFRSWHRLSITTIRKVFQLTSCIGVAVFILIPGYLTCEHRYGVIACLSLCTFFESIGVTAGHIPNIIDIAPRYSSLIFGVSNTIATIPGIIAPMVVATITKSGTSEEWRVVLFIAAGISVFAAVVYGIFADSELAPWAIDKENTIEIEVKLTKESETNGHIPNAV